MKKSDHLEAIDGLRGMAILMVIYQHTLATEVGRTLVRETGLTYPYLVKNGWMGVSLFFVLSGFVLARPFFSGSRQMKNLRDVCTFYRRRARRLLPLFFVMAFVSYAFGLAEGQNHWHSLLMIVSTGNMFSVEEFFPKLNGPYWSLSVEIWFSVLFPFVLIALAKYGFRGVGVAIIVLAFGIRVMGADFAFRDQHINPVKDFVLARLDDFFVGMLLAFWHAHDRLPKLNANALALFGMVVLGATAFVWDLRLQRWIPGYVVAGLNNCSQIGFGAILIAALKPGMLQELLSVWCLRVIGAMCFSIYLWHVLLIPTSLSQDPFAIAPQLKFWVMLMVWSSITYRYIEFPHEPSWKRLFLLEW